MYAQKFSTALLGLAVLALGLNGCATTSTTKASPEASATVAPETAAQAEPIVASAEALPAQAESVVAPAELTTPSLSQNELNKQLWEAAQAGNTDSVRSLLEQGADPSTATASGETALHAAVAAGVLPAVMLLVGKGAVINATTATGWTPLHHAARFGRADIANYLIKQGADSKALTAGTSAKTPVQMALDQGDLRTARILGY